METQTSHDNKSRLQTIERKVQEVQETLHTRLPSQYRHEAALVCATKWRLRALQSLDAPAIIKKLRLELGAFDYRVKEQAELLTRYILELDDVLSLGDNEIKQARKALVVTTQELLVEADAFKERSAKLKRFAEDVLEGAEGKTLEPSSESEVESDDLHVKALFGESEDNEEEEMEETDAEEDEAMQSEDDEKEDDEVDEEEEEKEKEEEMASPQTMDVDVNSLPVWRPYYQLQRQNDGIYLTARLNKTDSHNVRVQWNEHNGVLRISGFRLPTQKDIIMSRLSGAPTFGRFEIVEQFPRNLFNMEEASQQISEDGTLQIRMPYNMTRRPMRYRPASLFRPQDCFVW